MRGLRASCSILSVLLPFCLVAPAAAGSGGEIEVTWGDSLTVAAGEIRGLAWLDDDHYVALVAQPDTLPDMPPLTTALAWFDALGNVTREEDFTGTLSRGLAFDGKYLWSLGDAIPDAEATLYKIESDTLFVDAVYPTPGHRPCGLAWDGRYVWMVDRDRGRLDSFDPETEEISRSELTPAFSPCGLAFDGRAFWTCDSGTGRLYRLSRGGGAWSGTVSREGFDFRGRDVMLAWDGASLWAVPQSGGVARRMRIP
ncbi:hypothetical protein KKA85_05740 [bacterium]|nr:hypothetical protein [bacterium]